MSGSSMMPGMKSPAPAFACMMMSLHNASFAFGPLNSPHHILRVSPRGMLFPSACAFKSAQTAFVSSLSGHWYSLPSKAHFSPLCRHRCRCCLAVDVKVEA